MELSGVNGDGHRNGHGETEWMTMAIHSVADDLAEVGQDLVGMVGRGDRLVDLGDLPLRIDQVTDPGRMRRLIVGGAIGDADNLVGVAEQIVGEVELLLEGLVLLGRIKTDAEDDCIAL